MRLEDGYFIFENGEKIYTGRGILGLESGYSAIFYGYDGYVDFSTFCKSENYERHIVEICDYMIEEWKMLKDNTKLMADAIIEEEI